MMRKKYNGARQRRERESGPIPIPQWQLARVIGRAQSSVSQYETGVFDPPHHVAVRIAVALGIDVAELYVDDVADENGHHGSAA